MSRPQPLGHGGRIEGHPITGNFILSSVMVVVVEVVVVVVVVVMEEVVVVVVVVVLYRPLQKVKRYCVEMCPHSGLTT